MENLFHNHGTALPKRTILVVEDDRDIREGLADLLVSEGFTVLLAENGTRAYELVISSVPDVIILDLHLPDEFGGELVARIKKCIPSSETPVIVFTALDGIASIPGTIAVLQKPLNIRILLKLLKRHLI